MSSKEKPLVVVTGVAGKIGNALASALESDFAVVGMDVDPDGAICPCYRADLTSGDSIELALRKIADDHGDAFASVIHLAAYFDFTGEPHPLYEKLNRDGTALLLDKLQAYRVEQFVYSGTMLVHAPCSPGEHIDEDAPIEPKWAYPRSKAAAEQAIHDHRGDIPAVYLHLAGLYDDDTAVPTLSHQIARVYERNLKSHLYAGDPSAGQALIHQDDMVDLFHRTVARRGDLPPEITILAGEPDPPSYEKLQNEIGRLIHGAEEWTTLSVPAPVAKAGAWAGVHGEPIVPDAFDQGHKPFVRPFMVEMASDHYALDISRAGEMLGWSPQHDILEVLPALVAALKADPAGWYAANGIPAPDWLQVADDTVDDPDGLLARHRDAYVAAHRSNLWAPFLNLGIAAWLITSPPLMGYQSAALVRSDILSGIVLAVFAFLALSPRFGWARWGAGAVGLWLLCAPLVFWAPTQAAYLNDTILGALVIGFALLTRPPPGIDPTAAQTGPVIPPGWAFTPSSWMQRMPIIILAIVGLQISRYLTAYQLGHIDSVWEPFFSGGPGPKNGTEEIITSKVSEAWPVPDAGLGALTYMLEILTGIIGSNRRWRTMPWLVILFGIMIVPLGAVSITFIIIQPIVIGTWCTLCLIAAAAMLIQIPYSLDEIVATIQFLARRKKAGRPLLRIFFVGDTDDMDEARSQAEPDDFRQPPMTLVKDMVTGGVTLPWNLALCLVIGIALMFTRITFGNPPMVANWEHLIGALAVTVTVTALAEVARPIRFLNVLLGVGLIAIGIGYDLPVAAMATDILLGLALIGLSIRRGRIHQRYGGWSRFIV